MQLLTASQMKEIDRAAIEDRGIPSTVLMERAAEAIVREILELPLHQKTRNGEAGALRTERPHSAIIYCGPGNNGGDGIAAARLLRQKGWDVRCVLVGAREKMTADSQEMQRRLIEVGGELEDFDPENRSLYLEYDVAVDALFGIGLNSPLRSAAIEAVELMQCARWTVSADIPSGVHADTGMILGDAVNADVTVTFSAGKPGLYAGDGAVCAGRIVVADIGIPQDLLGKNCAVQITPQPILYRRKRDAHKGNFGKLFILAGSVGYTGAPVLAARAAVRAGAGLVTVAVPQEIYTIVAGKCDEAMVWPWSDCYDDILKKAAACDVVLIGPGLGQGQRAEEIVLALLRDLTCPVVLDADGLNIISKHIDVLDYRKGVTILTPHDGEFARLCGCMLPLGDRLNAAMDFAQAHDCVVVLKGYRTITAMRDYGCTINTTGNPGMARGGSGDALAGMMGALLGQRDVQSVEIFAAVADAVWFHGRAGDLAAADKGEYGMTVGDLIEQIPYAMKECEEA